MTSVGIVNIAQDDHDDGISELVITLSDGQILHQKWEWPDLIFRDKSRNNDGVLHEFWCTIHEEKNWDLLYEYTRQMAKLIEGTPLKPIK